MILKSIHPGWFLMVARNAYQHISAPGHPPTATYIGLMRIHVGHVSRPSEKKTFSVEGVGEWWRNANLESQHTLPATKTNIAPKS